MSDSIQVADTTASAVVNVVNDVNLPQLFHELAPFLYFVGAIIVFAVVFFILDARSNKKTS